jgi:hypothetical protein
MDLNCDVCHAKYDIELVNCEKKNKFSYHCIFCGNKLLEINENKEFFSKNILHFPIPQIGLPGLVCSTINNFMGEYKELFKEISIKKGQATSSLDISLDDDDFVPSKGWNYIQLEGQIDEKYKTEIKSLEDCFKSPGMVLKIYFLHNSKEVKIPNIMIPYTLRHKGIGKHIISVIYGACKIFGYRLFIVQMVDSFYNRLLKRGAIMIDEDSVEITDDAKLC